MEGHKTERHQGNLHGEKGKSQPVLENSDVLSEQYISDKLNGFCGHVHVKGLSRGVAEVGFQQYIAEVNQGFIRVILSDGE